MEDTIKQEHYVKPTRQLLVASVSSPQFISQNFPADEIQPFLSKSFGSSNDNIQEKNGDSQDPVQVIRQSQSESTNEIDVPDCHNSTILSLNNSMFIPEKSNQKKKKMPVKQESGKSIKKILL